MIERERWIIYPLLFFALAMHLWGYFAPLLTPGDALQVERLECQTLIVRRPDKDQKALVEVGYDPGTEFGRIDLFGPDPVAPAVRLAVEPAARETPARGVVTAPCFRVRGPAGARRAELQATAPSAELTVSDAQGEVVARWPEADPQGD